MRHTLILAALLSTTMSAPVSAAISLEDLLRRSQYDDLSISPGGEFLAATVMADDRSVLVVVRREDMKITATIDPGKEGYVENAYWANANRVFASTSKRFGLNAGASVLPMLFGIDADGKNANSFAASVVALLPDDDEHMLISVCRRPDKDGCWNRVEKVSVNVGREREVIIDAPVQDADFVADNAGRVRFAWATDDDDNQKLYVRGVEKDAPWKLINDESTSGVEVYVIGTSRDSRRAFLRSERKTGPDAIESYEFESGTRSELLRDEIADPAEVVTTADNREPIGVTYRTAVPTFAFWNPQHPDAQLQMEIQSAFPSEFAPITSSSRDGRYSIISVTSDREPGRYYLFDKKIGELKLLNKRKPWIDGEALVAMRPIKFDTRDGLTLHGYVAQPSGSTGPQPMVVMPHGGPYWVMDRWEFDVATQALAGHGYSVLRVNFRGSGGFGRAFADSGYGQWGRAMQDDVTDATKWAIAQGIADPKRICIFGASYGGYAALMGAVKEPDLYRCTIGVAGVYDLDVFFRWGDIQRTRYGERYLERAVGTDREHRAQHSPARRASEIRAAIMLVHGGRDLRVPPEQVRAMRAALDRAGIAYEGYFPSYEAHGIADAENQLAYYQRVLAFLDKHIGTKRSRADAGDTDSK